MQASSCQFFVTCVEDWFEIQAWQLMPNCNAAAILWRAWANVWKLASVSCRSVICMLPPAWKRICSNYWVYYVDEQSNYHENAFWTQGIFAKVRPWHEITTLYRLKILCNAWSHITTSMSHSGCKSASHLHHMHDDCACHISCHTPSKSFSPVNMSCAASYYRCFQSIWDKNENQTLTIGK